MFKNLECTADFNFTLKLDEEGLEILNNISTKLINQAKKPGFKNKLLDEDEIEMLTQITQIYNQVYSNESAD